MGQFRENRSILWGMVMSWRKENSLRDLLKAPAERGQVGERSRRGMVDRASIEHAGQSQECQPRCRDPEKPLHGAMTVPIESPPGRNRMTSR